MRDDSDAVEDRAVVLHEFGHALPKGVSATKFDPKSIMLYSFDAELFADGLGATNENAKLSPTDATMIRQMYPS